MYITGVPAPQKHTLCLSGFTYYNEPMSGKSLLYILLAATLVYRGSFLLDIFCMSTLYSGIPLEVVDGLLTVQSEENLDPLGRKTVAARAGLQVGDHILEFQDS